MSDNIDILTNRTHDEEDVRNRLYAFYDLDVAPGNFDFLKFLILAEIDRRKRGLDSLCVVIIPGRTHGFRPREIAGYIGHGASTYDYESLRWKARNILVPCCWQLPSCKGVMVCSSRDEARMIFDSVSTRIYPRDYSIDCPTVKYNWQHVAEAFNSCDERPTLKATPQAIRFVKQFMQRRVNDRKMISTTLRESPWHLDRNSSIRNWGAFANSLNKKYFFPVIVKDTDAVFDNELAGINESFVISDFSWNVELRSALYELSYLNLFTNCGPTNLCRLNTSTRWIIFKMVTKTFKEHFFQEKWGLNPGEQYHFQTEFQRFVWEEDKAEIIKTEFDAMCKKIDKNGCNEVCCMEKRLNENR